MRWGPRAGGIASAFPAIVGPVLVIDLLEHGAAFTARAATGTLVGLTTLAAFAAVYARAASSGAAWPRALALAWAAAGALGLAVSGVELAPLPAAAVATAALVLAILASPPAARRPVPSTRGGGTGWRMLTAAILVVALAAAAGAVGPVAGGVLAALPVLASVLAAFTHRDDGPAAAVALLRGMLLGMGGFVAFCLLIALLVDTIAPALAFAAATAAALTITAAATLNQPSQKCRAG